MSLPFWNIPVLLSVLNSFTSILFSIRQAILIIIYIHICHSELANIHMVNKFFHKCRDVYICRSKGYEQEKK